MTDPATMRPRNSASGSGLRVLITNNTFAARAGTEMFVRDLALGLARRGHRPVAYSTVLGEVAAELERHSIPVIDDLDALGEEPDVIHGQHHLDAMAAMTRFPSVPAVYVCHGWLPWEELPPLFPSIREYVAVDDLCLERLLTTPGIPRAVTRVIHNAVDLDRFAQRPPLPARPTSALIFSNLATADNFGGVIARACRDAGIARVDIVGRDSGHPVAAPEDVLGEYDVVFAKGRSAIEAAAVGCAVVVADSNGMSGMTTSARLPRVHGLNFGLRVEQDHRVTGENVARALADYDPADAAAVSAWLRANSSLDSAVDRWEGVYADVLRGPDPTTDTDTDAVEALRAASRYLTGLVPVLKSRDDAWAAAERMRVELGGRIAEADARVAEADARVAELDAALEDSRQRWEVVTRSRAWRASTVAWRINARLPRRAQRD